MLVIPGDVAAEAGAAPDRAAATSSRRPAVVHAGRRPVEALARADQRRATTVTLFAGAGVRDARDEVLALAAQVNAPVGHSLGGKEWIQYDNPYDVGMSGLLGYGACYEATHEADLLVLLGTDFPYDGFLPQAHTVQVDRDARAPRPAAPRSTSACTGDVGDTLRALLPLLDEKTDRTFLDRMLRHHAEALEHVVDAYTQRVERPPARSTPSTSPRCSTRS